MKQLLSTPAVQSLVHFISVAPVIALSLGAVISLSSPAYGLTIVAAAWFGYPVYLTNVL